MEKKLSVRFAALLALAVFALTAACAQADTTQTLVSGAKNSLCVEPEPTHFKGSPTNLLKTSSATNEAFDETHCLSGAPTHAEVVVTPLPWGGRITGAQWVSVKPNGLDPYEEHKYFIYNETFKLCKNQVASAKIEGQMFGDDEVGAFLNGQAIGHAEAVNGFNWGPTAWPFGPGTNFKAGLNTLQFVVYDKEEYTGVDFRAIVHAVACIRPLHWKVNGKQSPEGVNVQTMSWGRLTFTSARFGSVTCKKSDAGNVWNPKGGGTGLDNTVLFELYECEAKECPGIKVTALALPWASELEEVPAGSGVMRDKSKGMSLEIECPEREASEVFTGDVTPILHNGTKSKSTFDEFSEGAGLLHAPEGPPNELTDLRIAGDDYMAGFEKQEVITAAQSSSPAEEEEEKAKVVKSKKEVPIAGTYAVLGEELAFGYSHQLFNENKGIGEQPGAFEHGYANEYFNLHKPAQNGLQLINASCPGETTDSLIGNGPLGSSVDPTGEAPCPYQNLQKFSLHYAFGGEASQLERTLEVIAQEASLGTPVTTLTLGIGPNDERRAIAKCEAEVAHEYETEGKSAYGGTPSEAGQKCVAAHAEQIVAHIVANVATIVSVLRNGAEYGGLNYAGKIIVLGDYDPYGNVLGTGELLPGSNALTALLNQSEAKALAGELGACFVNPQPVFNPQNKQEPSRLQQWTNMANTTTFEGEANGPDPSPTPAGYVELGKLMNSACG